MRGVQGRAGEALVGVQRRCGICRELGHRRETCPSAYLELDVDEEAIMRKLTRRQLIIQRTRETGQRARARAAVEVGNLPDSAS